MLNRPRLPRPRLPDEVVQQVAAAPPKAPRASERRITGVAITSADDALLIERFRNPRYGYGDSSDDDTAPLGGVKTW
jgi:hypothetical protein